MEILVYNKEPPRKAFSGHYSSATAVLPAIGAQSRRGSAAQRIINPVMPFVSRSPRFCSADRYEIVEHRRRQCIRRRHVRVKLRGRVGRTRSAGFPSHSPALAPRRRRLFSIAGPPRSRILRRVRKNRSLYADPHPSAGLRAGSLILSLTGRGEEIPSGLTPGNAIRRRSRDSSFRYRMTQRSELHDEKQTATSHSCSSNRRTLTYRPRCGRPPLP
jgi:hypothetical protein